MSLKFNDLPDSLYVICMNRFWKFDILKNSYVPSDEPALSAFPTIVNMKNRQVFCRLHKQWENILAFKKNILKSGCGKLYPGPFTTDNTIFNYNFDISKKGKNWFIKVDSQTVSTTKRRLLENVYEVNTERKRLFKNGTAVFESADMAGALCKEITVQILGEMGARYREIFGICPTVASSLGGFSVILGYMLSPFNVNFYKIAQHWGLNPYDPDFASLSSGDTPSAENEMFSSLGIKPTKAIRKLYQKFPQSVIFYSAAKDLGFTDTNLLQKTASIEFYAFLKFYMISFADGDISYTIRVPLKTFVRDMLAISDQKTVWNSIERIVKFFVEKTVSNITITDALNMYSVCGPYLTEQEKKEVMHEGFNSYTHDFLLRRQHELAQDGSCCDVDGDFNLVFPIEQKFLDLEYKAGRQFRENPATHELEKVSDEERWCFYVARDNFTLKKIGSEMHNCVGWGYKNAVFERRSTIVYAKFRNKCKICIEVSPQFTIKQALGPANSQLKGEALDAFSEWCDKKNIVRTNVFGRIRIAP